MKVKQMPGVLRYAVAALSMLVLGCAAPPASVPGTAAPQVLVIMGTTDTHGWLLPFDYYQGIPTQNGLARLVPVIDSVRASNPGRTILVDSGDLLQGNPLDFVYRELEPGVVHPVAAAMNALRYDAAAIGNHEFNYGIPHLRDVIGQADFPFLSTNAYVWGTEEHAFEPYTIVERQLGDRTVRVGILGVTPPGVLLWDQQNVEGRIDFRDIVESVRPLVPRMRREGADVVVVAAHSGMEGTSYDPVATGVAVENVGAALAREIPGIDVIFLGHTHREVADTTIGSTLLVQAKNWGTSLALAELKLSPEPEGGWSVVAKHGELRQGVDASRAPAFTAGIEEYHQRTLEYVGRVVGESSSGMTSRESRVRDTPILDFINEVQRRTAGADLASTAAFSLTSRIPEGPITVADIAGLYIYDNTLKAIRISGAQLRSYLEKSAEYYLPCPAERCDRIVNPEIPGYNFDAISGVDYTLDLSQPTGSRVTTLTREGRAVEAADSFTLALNNYRASGAGGFNMLANAPVVYDGGDEIRELLIEAVRASGGLDPSSYFVENWRIVPESLRGRALPEQSPGNAASPAPKRLRVISTNDFHGTLRPTRPSWADGAVVGGAPVVAAYMKEARAAVDYPTILLDGGDVMQGTPISNLSRGEATVAYYNEVGYTAAAIGNHEFDWGTEVLRERIEQAEFGWLSANLFLKGSHEQPEWVEPTRLVRLPGCGAGPPTCDSVTVGIIGISTTETPFAAMPSYVAPFEFEYEGDAIDRWVPILRDQGADFVIVTAHEGAYCEDPAGPATECTGPMTEIIPRLQNRPDLIVSGHTHTVLNLRIDGEPVVQSGSYGTRITISDLEKFGADSVAVHVEGQPVMYAEGVAPDSAVAALVDRYEQTIGSELYEVITHIERTLPRLLHEESELGNLVADAQRAATRADVALMNNGGIRIALNPGPATFEDLFRLQPFANTLVVLRLTGAELLEALEHAVATGTVDASASGVRVRWDPSRAVGSRIVDARLDSGEMIRPDVVYRVTANNFMVDGGDGFAVLERAKEKEFTGIVDLDALIQYIRALPDPLPLPETDRFMNIR